MKIADYIERCKNFSFRDTQAADVPGSFYTTSDEAECGWISSPGNEHRGIDVSWAEGLSELEIIEQASDRYYDAFCKAVEESIPGWLPEELKESHVTIIEVKKNNDHLERALIISRPDVNISPTIYLAQYFREFQKSQSSCFAGNDDFGRIMNNIAAIYAEHSPEKSFDVSSIMDWEKVRDNLVCRMVNRKMNENNLADRPFIEKGDFAITFHIDLGMESRDMPDCTSTVAVNRQMLVEWNRQVPDGITLPQLYEIAETNTMEKYQVSIRNIADLIRSMGAPEDIFLGEEPPMYVVTNKNNMHGAFCVTVPQCQDEIERVIGKSVCYVIPSSVHECLVLPADFGMSIEYLNEMVQEVNRTQLAENEILGDHAYILDTKQHLLVSAPEYERLQNLRQEQQKEQEMTVKNPKL